MRGDPLRDEGANPGNLYPDRSDFKDYVRHVGFKRYRRHNAGDQQAVQQGLNPTLLLRAANYP
jgi:hypothetical protein